MILRKVTEIVLGGYFGIYVIETCDDFNYFFCFLNFFEKLFSAIIYGQIYIYTVELV